MNTNSKLLKSYIVRYDGTQEKLAEAMGISLSRLNAKINGTGGADFSQSEIAFIRMRYKLSNREVCDIFLQALYLYRIYKLQKETTSCLAIIQQPAKMRGRRSALCRPPFFIII